ncbi:ParA family protein [Solidesulfovibrio sp.]
MNAHSGKIVSVLNCKGGVGRTTVVFNIAHALALLGKKVLVIDNTIEGALTDCLCRESDSGSSLYEIFASGGVGYDVRNSIHSTEYDKIDIIPCIDSSHVGDQSFLSKLSDGLHKISEDILDVASSEYDFTIIDNPPGGDAFLSWTLIVADLAIVPTICFNSFAQSGIKTLMKAYDGLKLSRGVRCEKFFVLLNEFDIGEGIDYEPYEIVNSFGCMSMFRQVVPVCKKYRRLLRCDSILRSCPRSICAMAYRSIAKEFLAVIKS